MKGFNINNRNKIKNKIMQIKSEFSCYNISNRELNNKNNSKPNIITSFIYFKNSISSLIIIE
jgi:hypothetical protein